MTSTHFGCRGSQEKIGILLAQLGTPDSPTSGALRTYLRQFLSDARVIETNRTLWWIILNGIILRTRPRRSARLYARIWEEEGSPLLLTTQDQTDKLRTALPTFGVDAEVVFGMRYGTPSLESALDTLIERGCNRILLFPLYPQYAAATTGSTYDAVFTHLLKRRWVPTLRVAEPYYRHPLYLQALAATINEAYQRFPSRPEKLVLSYHGIPQKYIDKGDPYCCMCTETTEALIPLLNIPRDQIIHTYQSRFGRDPWLVPYTDEVIDQLARNGTKRIAVACPGFTADCLETLDELGNEGSEAFQRSGGEKLYLIPCLNSHPTWIASLRDLVREELGSWLRTSFKTACVACPVEVEKHRQMERNAL